MSVHCHSSSQEWWSTNYGAASPPLRWIKTVKTAFTHCTWCFRVFFFFRSQSLDRDRQRHIPCEIPPWNSMEFHGNPWKSMEIYGNRWNSMEIDGNPWNSTELLWSIHGISMEFHRMPWSSMEYPWSSMECHGVPWNAMEFHGVPWSSDGVPWNAMKFHGISSSSMECHGVPWSTDAVPWNAIACPWSLIEYHAVCMRKSIEIQ